MRTRPLPAILAAQDPAGYWVRPGPGYGPKYQGTIWQVVFLAQFGADGGASRVRTGCEYALSHNVAAHGGISISGAPSSFVHCMAGNLAAALIDLGFLEDDRLRAALEWQAPAPPAPPSARHAGGGRAGRRVPAQPRPRRRRLPIRLRRPAQL